MSNDGRKAELPVLLIISKPQFVFLPAVIGILRTDRAIRVRDSAA